MLCALIFLRWWTCAQSFSCLCLGWSDDVCARSRAGYGEVSSFARRCSGPHPRDPLRVRGLRGGEPILKADHLHAGVCIRCRAALRTGAHSASDLCRRSQFCSSPSSSSVSLHATSTSHRAGVAPRTHLRLGRLPASPRVPCSCACALAQRRCAPTTRDAALQIPPGAPAATICHHGERLPPALLHDACHVPLRPGAAPQLQVLRAGPHAAGQGAPPRARTLSCMVWPWLTRAGRRSCTTRGRSRRRSAPLCRGRARAVTTCSLDTPPCSLSSTASCRPTLPRCAPECLYFRSPKRVFVLSERAPRCAPRRAAPYAPRRRQGWHPLHIFCSALNGFGMFCILAAHEHYTLDVLMGLAPAPSPPCICTTAVAARTLVALTRGGPVTRRAGFYVSTRTFQSYHAIAHANSAEEGQYPSGKAHKQRRRWFPMVSYLEKNIAGTRGPHPPRFRESRRLVRIEEVGSAVGGDQGACSLRWAPWVRRDASSRTGCLARACGAWCG